jgi:hypothetical protein
VIKIMFAARAKPGLTRAQALRHLRYKHAPLVFACHTNRQRQKTYIQNHALEAPATVGATLDRDWVIEQWRDETFILTEPPVAQDAILVREDTGRFPDRATLLTVQVKERSVWQAVDDEPFAAAPIKLFNFYCRPHSMSREDFDPIIDHQSKALSTHPAFRREIRSYISNRTQPGEGPPVTVDAHPSADKTPPCDAVDVWRFRDAEAARRLFEDNDFRQALGEFEKQVSERDSSFRLLTEENMLFDDAKVDPASRR